MKNLSDTVDYSELLAAYRTLWVNRPIVSSEEQSKEVLLEMIRRDLRDENSHPRARKNPYAKFYLATRRILDSTITDDKKLVLMNAHIEIFENIEKN